MRTVFPATTLVVVLGGRQNPAVVTTHHLHTMDPPRAEMTEQVPHNKCVRFLLCVRNTNEGR